MEPKILWDEDREFSSPALDEKFLPASLGCPWGSLLHPTVFSKEVTNGVSTENPRVSGKGVPSRFLSEGPESLPH